MHDLLGGRDEIGERVANRSRSRLGIRLKHDVGNGWNHDRERGLKGHA